METVVETQGDVTVVRVSGSLDGLSAPKLQEVLATHLEAGSAKLVGCLEGVDYTSSAGLRTLLGAMKVARTRGGDLRLASAQPAVMKVLEMSGFASILKIFDGIDGAVASYTA